MHMHRIKTCFTVQLNAKEQYHCIVFRIVVFCSLTVHIDNKWDIVIKSFQMQ